MVVTNTMEAEGTESIMETNNSSMATAGGAVISTQTLMTELDRFLTLALAVSDKRGMGGRGSAAAQADIDEAQAAETALFLLGNLPPARPAALNFLAHTLSKQVASHMRGFNGSAGVSKEKSGKKTEDDTSMIGQLEALLTELVESQPGVWGPLVASWAVEQLGRWSVEWANTVVGRGDATLEEVVAGWLLCSPARTLASLTVSCVTHDPDAAVAALLEASGGSGPALDWLVAHVGCSFPATVINRVLSLGLRSFASYQGRPPEHQLHSVNKILSHLAERHLPDIRRGLHAILTKTFSSPTPPDVQTQASVPFLLCLAAKSRSRSVLIALMSGIDTLLAPPERLLSLSKQVSWWVPTYLSSHGELLDMVVHLILDTGGGAATQLLRLLLQGAIPKPQIPVKVTNAFNAILQGVVGEICSVTYIRRTNAPGGRICIRFLVGMCGGGEEGGRGSGTMVGSSAGSWAATPLAGLVGEVIATAGSQHVLVHQLTPLLTLLVVQQGPATAAMLLGHLLHCTDKPCSTGLSHGHEKVLRAVITALMIHQGGSGYNTDFNFSLALTGALEPTATTTTLTTALNSLEAMLSKGTCGRPEHPVLAQAVSEVVPRLAQLLNIPQVGSATIRLLCQLPLQNRLPMHHIYVLSHAAVFRFFRCLHEADEMEKISGVGQCQHILRQLSHSTVALNLIIRLFVEGVFRPEIAPLFGAAKKSNINSKETREDLLLTSNREFDSWVKMPQSHTSVFHEGIIGKGTLKSLLKPQQSLSSDTLRLHTQLLINTLFSCCSAQGPQSIAEGLATVSLLMVELISPDIMFNGFPWPDEFIKFTFERDLAIKKTFEDFPVAWKLLELVASQRAALSYGSVLVRALTASYTAFWNTCPLASATQAEQALDHTTKLLQVMVTAHFLPPVMKILPQMLPHLAPFEIVCVLQDVWLYMRDHTPLPDTLMESDQRAQENLDPRYTERIKRIIQANIHTIGHLLPGMTNVARED